MTKDQFDKWNDSLHESKDKDEQCVHSNETKTATERSFDLSCTSPTAKSTGHVEMFIDSDEKGHGSVHMVRTALQGPQAMQPITIDVKFDTHYVGSDCGDIKPGQGQPGVDDVLDHQDVLAGDVGIEVLENADHARRPGA